LLVCVITTFIRTRQSITAKQDTLAELTYDFAFVAFLHLAGSIATITRLGVAVVAALVAVEYSVPA
jgi:amino acid permease